MLGGGLVDYAPPVALKVQAEQNSQGDSARESHRSHLPARSASNLCFPLRLVQLLNSFNFPSFQFPVKTCIAHTIGYLQVLFTSVYDT